MPKSEFGPDGTQAPPPLRLFPDPLAGLVTADVWIVPQWTSYSSPVVVPTPLTPTQADEARQAIWMQMELEHEQRRPRTRRQRAPQQQQSAPHQYGPQQYGPQMPVAQQHQPTKQSNGVAAFIGCLVVIGFLVLVVVSILGAIFS